VELVPEALLTVSRAVEALGGVPALRMARMKDGPVITDHGNFVLDVRFPAAFDPPAMERELALIPGLLAHGIFTRPVSDLLVGWPDGRVQHSKRG
jgi:ribose 5-phosphate isomerase A